MSTPLLAALLDVYINANLAELAAIVRDARDLPAVQRAFREQQHAQLQRANGGGGAGMTSVTPRRSPIGGAALDWALGIDNVAPLESGSFEAASWGHSSSALNGAPPAYRSTPCSPPFSRGRRDLTTASP